MGLLTGVIVEIYQDTWAVMAKVRVGGAFIHVPVNLVPEAKIGDRVLLEGGVAVALIKEEGKKE
jgi:hydrogenase maturation factor